MDLPDVSPLPAAECRRPVWVAHVLRRHGDHLPASPELAGRLPCHPRPPPPKIVSTSGRETDRACCSRLKLCAASRASRPARSTRGRASAREKVEATSSDGLSRQTPRRVPPVALQDGSTPRRWWTAPQCGCSRLRSPTPRSCRRSSPAPPTRAIFRRRLDLIRRDARTAAYGLRRSRAIKSLLQQREACRRGARQRRDRRHYLASSSLK